VRSALEWAQVRTLAAEGLSQREIARRLGINRRTVIRLAGSEQPPRYRRAAVGSQLAPLEPVGPAAPPTTGAAAFGITTNWITLVKNAASGLCWSHL
jgi:hypothetical protein